MMLTGGDVCVVMMDNDADGQEDVCMLMVTLMDDVDGRMLMDGC